MELPDDLISVANCFPTALNDSVRNAVRDPAKNQFNYDEKYYK